MKADSAEQGISAAALRQPASLRLRFKPFNFCERERTATKYTLQIKKRRVSITSVGFQQLKNTAQYRKGRLIDKILSLIIGSGSFQVTFSILKRFNFAHKFRFGASIYGRPLY